MRQEQMDKPILLSIILATVIIPVIGAKMPSPRRGLTVSIILMAVFTIVYVLVLMFVVIDLINTTRPSFLTW